MTYKVPEGWEEVKLGDIGEIVTGKTPSTKNKNNFGGDIPFLTPSDDMEGRFVKTTKRTLTEIGLNSVKNQLVPANSVCVSCIGSQLGKVTITKEDTVTNQQINSIIINKDNDVLFIYYAMLLLGKRIRYISKTSTAVPIINKTNFSKEKINLPPLQEQKAIADTLSAIDDKIELNNKINQNLEAQAQAIFKSWFIDFEPFQDGEFVESELGMIPKGWEVVNLNHLAGRKNGYSYRSKDMNEESNNKLITLKNFNRDGSYNNKEFRRIDITDRMKTHHYLKENDILVACTDLTQKAEVIGNPILYHSTNEFEKAIFSMDLVKIVPKNPEIYLYIYYILKDYRFKEFAKNYSTGTTVLHLNKKCFDDYRLAIGPKKIINSFQKLVEPIFNHKKILIKQNQKLSQLRDTLLPKLISGEIRIPLDK